MISERRQERVERLLLPVLGVSLCLFVFSLVWVNFLRPEEFQPLSFAEQVIVRTNDDGTITVPQVEGFPAPSVAIDDVIPVQGDVCNDHDEPVSVTGAILWERESPRGLRIEVATGTDEIEPGCMTLTFENPIPEEVSRNIAGRGEAERWLISGVVEIAEPNGGTVTWATEPFWVVP